MSEAGAADAGGDGFARAELLACVIARLVRDARHAAVGAASPVPAAGCLLARALGAPLRVSLLHRREGGPFSEGGRELFDLAGQGRIDVFFLGGAQIDGEANVNLVHAQGRRFPGSYGSAFLYFAARRTILFREEHSVRVFPPRVEFVSAPGGSPPGLWRRGRAQALLTGRALFVWDAEQSRFRLAAVHPGSSAAQVRSLTGFDYEEPRAVPETAPPTAQELALLRGAVAAQMAQDYPFFWRRVWGV